MLFYLSPSSKSCLIVSGPGCYIIGLNDIKIFGWWMGKRWERNIFHSESQTFLPSITLWNFGFSIFQTYALLFPCLLQPLTTVSINFVNIIFNISNLYCKLMEFAAFCICIWRFCHYWWSKLHWLSKTESKYLCRTKRKNICAETRYPLLLFDILFWQSW